jgi:hypothetical protein
MIHDHTPFRQDTKRLSKNSLQAFAAAVDEILRGACAPDSVDLSESARDGVDVLGEMRAMLSGAITLLDDPSMPAAPDDLKGLSDNLQALAPAASRKTATATGEAAR